MSTRPPCPAIQRCIAKGLLEPGVILDDFGRDIRGWVLTEKAREKYAPMVDLGPMRARLDDERNYCGEAD